MLAPAMILIAVMAIPADGPGKVSEEMVRHKLDLNGRWRGTMHIKCKECEGVIEDLEVNFKGLGVKDEGVGRLRLKFQGMICYGIYEQNGDRLEICFSLDAPSRPARFQAGEGQCLIVLHRVKSSK